MRAELLQLAGELTRRGEPFVLAVVVRRQSYSSAQRGDMALITADGSYHGWLGGNCTQPTVKREAARALADGRPRLLSLSPEPETQERPGVTVLPMVCQSGGTVEIYLEPILPSPRLLLFGLSPVIRALAQLGKALGYSVDVVDPAAAGLSLPGVDRTFGDLEAPALRPASPTAAQRLFAVVATMGEHDEDSVVAALGTDPAYLGVVASRTRFGQIREALLGRGISAAALERIHSPAGLDIGARLPEEVALSVLAQIVQLHRAQADQPLLAAVPPPAPSVEEAIDPVCGMTVVVATARHRAEHGGKSFYFCNPRCREKFLAQPEQFLASSRAGGAG